MEKTNYDIIDSLHRGDVLSRDEWMSLLSSLNADEREYLRSKAQEVAVAHYGKGVFVRALLEISSYCKIIVITAASVLRTETRSVIVCRKKRLWNVARKPTGSGSTLSLCKAAKTLARQTNG